MSYTLKQVPAEKLLLGVPWYGYDWEIGSQERAAALRYPEVVNLWQHYGATIQQDATSHTPYFEYTDEQGDRHEVWFDDATSFRARLDLAEGAGVAGVGGWRLGHEDPAIWSVW